MKAINIFNQVNLKAEMLRHTKDDPVLKITKFSLYVFDIQD